MQVSFIEVNIKIQRIEKENSLILPLAIYINLLSYVL